MTLPSESNCESNGSWSFSAWRAENLRGSVQETSSCSLYFDSECFATLHVLSEVDRNWLAWVRLAFPLSFVVELAQVSFNGNKHCWTFASHFVQLACASISPQEHLLTHLVLLHCWSGFSKKSPPKTIASTQSRVFLVLPGIQSSAHSFARKTGWNCTSFVEDQVLIPCTGTTQRASRMTLAEGTRPSDLSAAYVANASLALHESSPKRLDHRFETHRVIEFQGFWLSRKHETSGLRQHSRNISCMWLGSQS